MKKMLSVAAVFLCASCSALPVKVGSLHPIRKEHSTHSFIVYERTHHEKFIVGHLKTQ